MRACFVMAAVIAALGVSGTAQAGTLITHDAVVVGDGSTRLLNCQNTKGHMVVYAPIAPAEAFVVRAATRNERLSDVLAQILPNGWTVRYTSPNVEGERVNLEVSTYWVDAVKVLTHDFNLMTIVDGEKRQLVVGRL